MQDYTDNLSDVDLDAMLRAFRESGAIGGFLAVRPNHSFHIVSTDEESMVESIQYRGFWTCMDTFKEKQQLDDLYAQGSPPWEVWRRK